MSSTAMIDTLTPIWLRVLQISSVGVDDNFFDLGGDSALALELFNEVALKCGVELPPVAIYQTPTIAALAAALERPSTLRIAPLVRLKPGREKTPVFIAHGLGGSAIDFYQVVKHIETPHAIHGLQAKGIEGGDAPLDRIEDMARYSLDAIRQLQPHGPYLLVGFSLGGLVALEMAQQLIAEGESIGVLAMLDSYPNMIYLSPAQWTRLSTRLAWRWMAGRLQWLGVKKPFQTTVDTPLTPALERLRACDELALERYRPRYYPGKINFVRAAIPTDFPADPVAVWSELSHEFEVQTVPGDHLGMMTVEYESLGAAISRCLNAAKRE